MNRRLRKCCALVLQILRGALASDAYERYIEHCRSADPAVSPLSREQFFRRELSARWDGPCRCC
jgi:uncharacterized short protein YbdD (DUF466 family)